MPIRSIINFHILLSEIPAIRTKTQASISLILLQNKLSFLKIWKFKESPSYLKNTIFWLEQKGLYNRAGNWLKLEPDDDGHEWTAVDFKTPSSDGIAKLRIVSQPLSPSGLREESESGDERWGFWYDG